MINSTAQPGSACWEAQQPMRISRMPEIIPSHQTLSTTPDWIEVTEHEGSLQDQQQPDDGGQGPEGAERIGECQIALPRNSRPNRTCAPPQRGRTEARTNSPASESRKTTPTRTPMVAAEVIENGHDDGDDQPVPLGGCGSSEGMSRDVADAVRRHKAGDEHTGVRNVTRARA